MCALSSVYLCCVDVKYFQQCNIAINYINDQMVYPPYIVNAVYEHSQQHRNYKRVSQIRRVIGNLLYSILCVFRTTLNCRYFYNPKMKPNPERSFIAMIRLISSVYSRSNSVRNKRRPKLMTVIVDIETQIFIITSRNRL